MKPYILLSMILLIGVLCIGKDIASLIVKSSEKEMKIECLENYENKVCHELFGE